MLGRPVKICLTREEVFYCHRGRHPVLMRLRTGVKRDGTITGMHLQTLLDGGAYGSYGVASTFYTGALQTVTYHVPRYRFEGCRVVHEQAAVRPEARPRHAAAALRPGGPARQDRRGARRSTRPSCACAIVEQPEHAHRELPARRHDRPRRVHPPRRRALGLEGQVPQAPARARRRPRLLVVPVRARGCRSTGTSMPHSGVQLKLDRGGGVTVFCGATEIGQGSDDVLVGARRRGARHRPVRHPLRHRRHRPDAGRPRLVLEPRHADDGQRRDPGRRARARRSWPRRSAAQARGPGRAARRSPAGACSTSRIRSVA